MKRNFTYTTTAILASLMTVAAVGASAQDAPTQDAPAQDAPASADTAAVAGTTAPKDFIQQAYLTNEFGVAAAQVALKQSTDADVKAAAQEVLTDGTATRQDMITAIQGSAADMQFDQNWTDEYKQKLADLQSVAGAEFDQKYVDLQSAETDKATALFSAYAASATDASTKAFASNTLPKLQAQAARLDAAAPASTAGTK